MKQQTPNKLRESIDSKDGVLYARGTRQFPAQYCHDRRGGARQEIGVAAGAGSTIGTSE